MKKFIKSLLICFLLCPFLYKAFTIDGLYSKNVLVYNLDEDKILYEVNSKKQVSIASLTKIMTTLVSLENIKDLNEEVTITYKMLSDIPYDASTAGLSVGDTLTYKDLLLASLIPSGADATQALAISLTGDISTFVDLMNEKAKLLGMNSTHYVNTTGLDEEGHYSTLNDLLILIKYALNNDTFESLFLTKSYTTTNNIKLKSTLNYYNTFNYDLSYVLGSKTGFTDDAGLCLLTLTNIDNTNLITITTDAEYNYGYFKNVKDLNTIANSLKDNYESVTLISNNEVLKKLPTKYAKQKYVEILSNKEIKTYMEKPYNIDNLKVEYTGIEQIPYNTKKGTNIGKVNIYYNEELMDTIDIKLDEELNFSLIEFITDNILTIIISIVVIIIIIVILPSKKKRNK